MSEDYEQRLADWMKRHGVPAERAMEPIPAGELRMIDEDQKSTAKDYCWVCGEEFPVKDMHIETCPYCQTEDGCIEEDGYVSIEHRTRKCVACEKRQADEDAGIEEGQEP